MPHLRKTIFTARSGSTLTIHESDGSGPVMFGIGGLSVRALAISGLYDAFDAIAAEGARCVLMEIAGAGESPMTPGLTMDTWLADVEQVFEERVREPAIWTGSSMGGWLMLLVHRRHPGWFRDMCAIAPAIDWDQQYIGPGLRDGKLGVIDGVVANRDGTAVAPRNLLISMAAHHLMRTPFALSVPLHVLFGGRDEMVPVEAMRQFIQRAHGAKCTGQIIVEADHSIAKLEWDFALGRFREWARARIDAARGSMPPGSEPAAPGTAR